MKRVIFFDPLEAKQRSAEMSKDRAPVPTAPSKPPSASRASPFKGREREVQQLINDLAVLAATRRPRPHN